MYISLLSASRIVSCPGRGRDLLEQARSASACYRRACTLGVDCRFVLGRGDHSRGVSSRAGPAEGRSRANRRKVAFVAQYAGYDDKNVDIIICQISAQLCRFQTMTTTAARRTSAFSHRRKPRALANCWTALPSDTNSSAMIRMKSALELGQLGIPALRSRMKGTSYSFTRTTSTLLAIRL